MIVTSRPEGVNLPLYIERFVVMNLLELSDEQQRNVIKVQMQGSEFFDHLLAVSERDANVQRIPTWNITRPTAVRDALPRACAPLLSLCPCTLSPPTCA